MKNLNRQVELVLYQLKKSLATNIVILNPSSSVDLATGIVTKTYAEYNLKAIILPIKYYKLLIQGSIVEVGERILIIDKKDVNFTFTSKAHCEFNQQRFEVKNFELSENGYYYILTLSREPSSLTAGFARTLTNSLTLEVTISAIKIPEAGG